jgi:hypothetical protein
VWSGQITNRSDYCFALGAGAGAREFNRDAPAAEEMARLWNVIEHDQRCAPQESDHSSARGLEGRQLGAEPIRSRQSTIRLHVPVVRTVASELVDELYDYAEGTVFFKPTLAERTPSAVPNGLRFPTP